MSYLGPHIHNWIVTYIERDLFVIKTSHMTFAVNSIIGGFLSEKKLTKWTESNSHVYTF